MKHLLVKDGSGPVWLAAVSGEDVYCYVPDTGKFHRNVPLRADYFMDRELEYVPIGVAEARCLIVLRVGSLDDEELDEILAEFRADPSPVDTDAVLAAALSETP